MPKTAGSSINKFFANNIKSHHFHIESAPNIDEIFCKKYDFISGHVPYNRMEKMLNLEEWITFATFREPVSYVISHLKWVRKLADAGEEKRFEAHPKIFQDIAVEMKNYNFSDPLEITKFIKWLESIRFYYFHNTQLHYMNVTNSQNCLTDTQVKKAIQNLDKVNFVGIQEQLDDYLKILSYEFGWDVARAPQENKNTNSYGFDSQNEEICNALLPLYEKDLIIYNEAKKKFNDLKNLYDCDTKETKIRGFIDIITPKKVIGWVRYDDSLTKVNLELKVQNKTVKTTLANIYRKGLKIKNIHPTGICAFEFEIDQIQAYKQIEVYVKGTELKLPFSKGATIE